MRFLSQALAWTVLVMMALGSMAPASAEEETPSLFDVLNVNVDVTDTTAAGARAKALAEAERRAFDIVLARVTLPEHRERATFNDAEIARLTRQFWVSDEKRSSVRYIAALNYSFRPDRVRQFLAARGVPMVEKQSPPVLVLPVYHGEGGAVLWQKPTPWWDAWAAKRPPGLVPVVLPSGNAADAGMISVEDALAGDSQKLSALAERYGVDSVVVASLRVPPEDSAQKQRMSLMALQWGNQKDISRWSDDVEVEKTDDESNSAVIHARNVILATIDNNWKRENLRKRYNLASFPVNIRVNGLKSWRSIENRLRSTDGIANINVLSMSQSDVLANISHYRTPEELSTTLMASNLYLFRDDTMGWVIDTSRPPPTFDPGAAASSPNVPTGQQFTVPGSPPPGSM